MEVSLPMSLKIDWICWHFVLNCLLDVIEDGKNWFEVTWTVLCHNCYLHDCLNFYWKWRGKYTNKRSIFMLWISNYTCNKKHHLKISSCEKKINEHKIKFVFRLILRTLLLLYRSRRKRKYTYEYISIFVSSECASKITILYYYNNKYIEHICDIFIFRGKFFLFLSLCCCCCCNIKQYHDSSSTTFYHQYFFSINFKTK